MKITMKKLLLVAALFTANSKSQAQTYDTTSLKPYAVVRLSVPFAPNWQDTTKAAYLNVTSNSDNLKDAASLHWVLFSLGSKPLVTGDIPLIGSDYRGWDGSNVYPFQFVAGKLGLAIR